MSEKTYNSSPTSTTIGVHGGKINLLNQIFEMLKQRGFVIQTDQHILRDYPILADTHWEGRKGYLLFKSKSILQDSVLSFTKKLIRKIQVVVTTISINLKECRT